MLTPLLDLIAIALAVLAIIRVGSVPRDKWRFGRASQVLWVAFVITSSSVIGNLVVPWGAPVVLWFARRAQHRTTRRPATAPLPRAQGTSVWRAEP